VIETEAGFLRFVVRQVQMRETRFQKIDDVRHGAARRSLL
jgi:hypothetical protein